MQQDATSIRISKRFKGWLAARGRYIETHEQILIRLIDDPALSKLTEEPADIQGYPKTFHSISKSKKVRK